jgi:hypothetical protein
MMTDLLGYLKVKSKGNNNKFTLRILFTITLVLNKNTSEGQLIRLIQEGWSFMEINIRKK